MSLELLGAMIVIAGVVIFALVKVSKGLGKAERDSEVSEDKLKARERFDAAMQKYRGKLADRLRRNLRDGGD